LDISPPPPQIPSCTSTVYNKNIYVIPAKRGKGYHAQLSIKIGLEASDQRKFTATALIDSGCTQSAINQSYIKEHNIPTTLIPFPLRVYNADGTQNKNGTIKRSVKMTVDLDGHRSVQEFFVTDLAKDEIFLGYDWLNRHNPKIDWTEGMV
jgi:hypothetical protein